jgi:hypothetical protein
MDRPALYFATFTDKSSRFTYVGMTGCAQHRPVASHLEGADRIYLMPTMMMSLRSSNASDMAWRASSTWGNGRTAVS